MFLWDRTDWTEFYGNADVRRGLRVRYEHGIDTDLKESIKRIPGLVFKGGTSLSKCYNLIDRFSEDVDLTLDDTHFTQSKRREAVKISVNVCEELKLKLINKETIEKHTHGNYNCYDIQCPIIFPSEDIKTELKVEMTYIQKSYPYEQRNAISYVGEFFFKNGNEKTVKRRSPLSNSFVVQVQSLERTLIDKVFAVCDYYLSNDTVRNSRHIYDISKLLSKVNIYDFKLKQLVESVRNERKLNRKSLSAQEGIDIPKILNEIIITDFFKKDYNETTLKLLTKTTSYENEIKALRQVIDSKLFKKNA